jgi:SAM-dependent methyltransferase
MAAQTQSTNTSKVNFDSSITTAWQDTDIAQRYKAAENATRPFAKIMVELSDKLTTIKTTPTRILDLACGTGAVEAEIYAAIKKEQWDGLKILAGDISEPMLDYLAKRGESEGWSGLETRVMDAIKLDLSQEEDFAHAFVSFAMFVLPSEVTGKLAQKVLPGGTVAISTWASLPWFDLLARTYAAMPDGPELPERQQLWASFTNSLPWNEASFVRQHLEEAGLSKVEVVQRKVTVECGTPDVSMTTMGFVIGMLSKRWPEEKREGWVKDVTRTMRDILVEDVGGVDGCVLMDFEGIVGVGLKDE